jgi:hypothetical protein
MFRLVFCHSQIDVIIMMLEKFKEVTARSEIAFQFVSYGRVRSLIIIELFSGESDNGTAREDETGRK